jgi:hypothetical protein
MGDRQEGRITPQVTVALTNKDQSEIIQERLKKEETRAQRKEQNKGKRSTTEVPQARPRDTNSAPLQLYSEICRRVVRFIS